MPCLCAKPNMNLEKTKYITNLSSGLQAHHSTLLWFMKRINPKITVDLGIWYGFSTFTFASAEIGEVYGIDHFQGDPFSGSTNTANDVNKSCVHLGFTNLTILKNKFMDVKWDKPIDLLLIDGNPQEVKQDYEKWSKFVTGVILIHDTEAFEEVRQLYREITLPKTNIPFGHGLGVISKDEKLIEDVKAEFKIDGRTKNTQAPSDFRKQTLIMLTSTPAHTRYLWRSVQSHLKLGCGKVIVGWDFYTFNYPKRLPDGVLVFPTQSLLGDQNGDAYQIETGLMYAIYNGYKYFLKSAGDIVIDRPENFDLLYDILGDGDLLSKTMADVDTKFLFGMTAPLYALTKEARSKRDIHFIEKQYIAEVANLRLIMKQCDFKNLLGRRHLQPGHEPRDLWNGIGLENGEW